jgi:hypothetical protein
MRIFVDLVLTLPVGFYFAYSLARARRHLLPGRRALVARNLHESGLPHLRRAHCSGAIFGALLLLGILLSELAPGYLVWRGG